MDMSKHEEPVRSNIAENNDSPADQRSEWQRYVLDRFETALSQGWIHAFCQPIVRVATGETCDVEALARWIDPERGLVPPAEFIPVLEDARLIHKLDLAVLRDVCRVCRELEDAGRPYIPPSVNLSRLDFELCDIVSEVEAVLDEYGIPRSMVSIEITESALVGSHEYLKEQIDRFRSEGFEVWMDDFGSGYSSLNVLKDYSFDLVKVDMAFLAGIEDSDRGRIMLAKVIDLIKELGTHTLVEGVETREQYEYLRSLGCGRAQGFYFGRPVPLPESIEGSPNDTHPEPELLAKRGFYEDIGLVNLMRPDPHASVTGLYLPSDVPACIIRRRDGVYEYLNVNDLYAKFLRDVGIGTPEDSEKVINDVGNPRRTNFVNVIDRCGESGDWERYPVLLPSNKVLVVRMKMVARNSQFDAIAVKSIVEEVIDIDAEGHEAGSDLRFA